MSTTISRTAPESYSQYQHFNLVATSGSGKTRFARALAQQLHLPCYETDQLFWKPGWQSSSDEELLSQVCDITSGQKRVLDGNYTRMTPVPGSSCRFGE